MTLEELKKTLESDIAKCLMSPQILLRKFNMLEEAARDAFISLDPTYFPFYYHLGKYLKPKNMVEIGFGLGINSGCFMSSCETVKEFFAFEGNTDGYAWRMGRNNILKINPKMKFELGIGDFREFIPNISAKKWDLVLFNIPMAYDEYRYILDILWDSLNLDGYMVVDKIMSEDVCQKAFKDLHKGRNKEYIKLKTLYGSGIIRK